MVGSRGIQQLDIGCGLGKECSFTNFHIADSNEFPIPLTCCSEWVSIKVYYFLAVLAIHLYHSRPVVTREMLEVLSVSWCVVVGVIAGC